MTDICSFLVLWHGVVQVITADHQTVKGKSIIIHKT